MLTLWSFLTYGWSFFVAYGKLPWSLLLTVEMRFGPFLLTVEKSVWKLDLFFVAYDVPTVSKRVKSRFLQCGFWLRNSQILI